MEAVHRALGRTGNRAVIRAVALAFAVSVWPSAVQAQCHAVAITAHGRPVTGIEDVAVDEAGGRVVLSAYDRSAPPEQAGGGLFLLPLAALAGERGEAVAASAGFHPVDGFRPHGIDLRVEADGSRSILAVNRRRDGSVVVERFSLDGDTLRHRGTVESLLLCRANDVAFLDGDRFLFTGDHGGCGWAAVAMENVLNLRRGFVGLVDTGRARVLAAGIGFANGLLTDPSTDRLYVAATREGAVLVYRLSALLAGDVGALPERIVVPGGPDNLSAAGNGRVLAAVHPSLFGLALHRAGLPGGETVPTRIVALGPAGVTVIAEDDGHRLPGATVAAVWSGGLIAGSATSDRLLVCGDASSGATRSSGWAAPAAPR